jgi:hypothetical protein
LSSAASTAPTPVGPFSRWDQPRARPPAGHAPPIPSLIPVDKNLRVTSLLGAAAYSLLLPLHPQQVQGCRPRPSLFAEALEPPPAQLWRWEGVRRRGGRGRGATWEAPPPRALSRGGKTSSRHRLLGAATGGAAASSARPWRPAKLSPPSPASLYHLPERGVATVRQSAARPSGKRSGAHLGTGGDLEVASPIQSRKTTQGRREPVNQEGTAGWFCKSLGAKLQNVITHVPTHFASPYYL